MALPRISLDLYDVCTIIDWESLLILPKHIAFRGDNGYYLRASGRSRDTHVWSLHQVTLETRLWGTRLTTEGKTNCLNAAVSTISKELCLEVGELVLSRNTYNVNFCLMDARIYNQRVIVMTTV
ncbi:hypothetical protein CK203_095135 [Vitis vinifera]|uniref:Uncharacterized protein n=1 Tax=Vitis vinifera TaxID=29760 RepID=A0A438C789_VITVI|nr:hypothetical protein CK203_095135 [Vitis vinifera]